MSVSDKKFDLKNFQSRSVFGKRVKIWRKIRSDVNRRELIILNARRVKNNVKEMKGFRSAFTLGVNATPSGE